MSEGSTKLNNQKYFFITVGPTGSGKSVVVRKACDILGIQYELLRLHLIDDLVENSDCYKAEVKRIIDTYKEKNNEEINKKKDEFNDAYQKAREHGCKDTANQPTSCNDINDKNMLESLENNNNIVFETTGATLPTWLWDTHNSFYDKLKEKKYRIVFLFPMVIEEKLKGNIETRFESNLKSFLEDDNNPAPRFPDPDSLFQQMQQCKNSMIDLFTRCKLNQGEKFCSTIHFDIMLFDNNENNMELVFNTMDLPMDSTMDSPKENSKINSLFNDLLNNYFLSDSDLKKDSVSNQVSVGGRKKSKRRMKMNKRRSRLSRKKKQRQKRKG